ncbi:unnamed protein product [Ixodes pacificus]
MLLHTSNPTVPLKGPYLVPHCSHPFSLGFGVQGEDAKVRAKPTNSLPARRVDILWVNVNEKMPSWAVSIHLPKTRGVFQLASGLSCLKVRPADVAFYKFVS